MTFGFAGEATAGDVDEDDCLIIVSLPDRDVRCVARSRLGEGRVEGRRGGCSRTSRQVWWQHQPVPRSVLLVTPRWVRDGGVGAHIESSAAALARNGFSVHVLAARLESEERIEGVTVYHSPERYKAGASMDTRFGEAVAASPAVIHLNQLDDPEVVEVLQRSAPVVISAHGFLACTSGVHYFRPGQECERAHGVGCVPNLLRCAHTRDP